MIFSLNLVVINFDFIFLVEDPMLSDTQQYRYMTVDNMKSLGDDSMPIDVTNDERHENKLFSGTKIYCNIPLLIIFIYSF